MERGMKNLLVTLLALSGGITHAADFQPEVIGQVASVPSPHPAHWLVVHDLAFNHMREGKLFIVHFATEWVSRFRLCGATPDALPRCA